MMLKKNKCAVTSSLDLTQDDSQTVEHFKGYFKFLSNIDLEKDASESSQYTGPLSVLKRVLKFLIKLHK